jgi:hypothetical protein|tara:strand:- start:157 stop:630 length:474 start_codon:yes stop_codon:yes gene_type:complete
MVRTSIEKVLHNLQFDRLFLDKIKSVEDVRSKSSKYVNLKEDEEYVLHGNGVPFHFVCVFKVLLCMREEQMKTKNISENYRSIFGLGINQSSLSRTLSYLANDLRLVEYVKNVHSKDARFTWCRLSREGKKFQKHLLGSTEITQPNVAEFRRVVNIT